MDDFAKVQPNRMKKIQEEEEEDVAKQTRLEELTTKTNKGETDDQS